MTSKYPPLNDWDLQQDKQSFETYVDQQRSQLAFLISEEERIQAAKKVCLESILYARRKILSIERKMT